MTRPIRNAVTLVVDGREVVAPEGTMLVDAAKEGDVEIPVFCYEPKLGEPVGACRMCLVEIEGIPKLQTACSTPVRDGMVVYTQTDQVKEAQNAVVEFLLVNHPLDCPVCDKGGECPLQDIAMGWGPDRSRFTDPKRHFQKPLELSPLVAIDRERCILCYRCVRFSQEVAEDEQLQLLERGDKSFVGTFDDRPYVAPFHGNITELCPVGALTNYTYRFRARPWDNEDAGSICTLCPSQCNVLFTVRDERVMRVLARDNEDVDDGWLCDKGRYGYQMIGSEDRITVPMLRGGDGKLKPASWDEALGRVADGLRAAGDRTAAIVGGGTSNEEGWLIQRITRDALGSRSVVSSPHTVEPGLAAELARPELTVKVGDIDFADAILVVGSDPLHEAPILDLRIRKAVRRSGARLAVASDRPTALDGGASAVARYAPGDVGGFLSALAGALGAEGDGPEGKAAAEVAEALRDADDVVIVWGERLWRSTDAVASLIDIARALGISDSVSSGLLEIPTSANGRGLREVGCMPSMGPGLSAIDGGRDATGIRHGLESGELSAALVAEVDPVRDYPNGEGWRAALKEADFVVAISMFEDSSASLADVVLPAESYAEKDGTVTHPDGRVQRVRQGVAYPGQVRPSWHWLLDLAGRLDLDLGFDSLPEVLQALTDDVPFYGGLTDDEIGGQGIRWQERPAAAELGKAAAGHGSAASPGVGVSRESVVMPEAAESVSGRRPSDGDGLLLGTYRDVWASEVTERNPALRFLDPQQKLELAPDDADKLKVGQGDEVTVSVNGSSVEARVAIRQAMRPGAAFLIEGLRENNANVLVDGAPQRVEVRPR